MRRKKLEPNAAGEAMRETVRNQIALNQPPEAKRTFERLRAEGMSDEGAIEFMAAVVATEIFVMMKYQKPFDERRYEAALRALPTLPSDDESYVGR